MAITARKIGMGVAAYMLCMCLVSFGLASAAAVETFVEVELDIQERDISQVTVFRDRAEVTRAIEYTPMEEGIHALVLRGVTEQADQDSIRIDASVDQSEGVNVLTDYKILEVQFEVHHRPRNDTTDASSEQEKQAQRDLEVSTAALKTIEGKLKRIDEQANLVQKYTEGMLTSGANSKNVATPQLDLDTVSKLLDFHLERLEHSDLQRMELEAVQEKTRKTKETALATLRDINRRRQRGQVYVSSRDVTVHLQVMKVGAPISLDMTYLVHGAHWKPTYDIRVTSATENTAAKMDITYFGVVSQNTGEDWNSTHLSLSTALPAVCGSPPIPPTKIARWKPVPHFHTQSKQNSRMMKKSGNRRMFAGEDMEMMPEMVVASASAAMPEKMMMMEEEVIMDGDMFDARGESGAAATMAVSTSASGSSTFLIERPSTILSDNREHKVTVTILAMEPELRYFAIPAMEQKAYIQARAQNNSPYPLLEGNRVAIFFDGSFVTTTHLKETSPGEDIDVFLGSDADVKVHHRQIDSRTGRGQEGGFFKGEQLSSHSFEYRTVVHNTKEAPVNITIVSILPRSTDKKITVSLEKPDAKHVQKVRSSDDTSAFLGLTTGDANTDGKPFSPLPGGGQLAQNEVTNNLVMGKTVAGREEIEIPFKYVVQWPHVEGEGGRDVEVVQNTLY